MFRKVFFQLHWFLGVTAGLIITVVGVTGAMLSFEPQILRLINPGVMTSKVTGEPLLPSELLIHIQTQQPERGIVGLTLKQDPRLSAEVLFSPNPGQRRGEMQYVNPYTGALLGQAQGVKFFIDVMRIHRWLLSGDIGKQIVGASTIVLVFLAISGLYLRWPRKGKWKSLTYWFSIKTGKQGRAWWWEWHAKFATWCLPLYVLACLTGLYWSYDWYRSGLFKVMGVEQSQRARLPAADELPPISGEAVDQYWSQFLQHKIGYSKAMLLLPVTDTANIRYFDVKPAHSRAANSLRLNEQGEIVVHDRYQDKPLNEKIMSSMLPLHSGEYFGMTGLILMAIASAVMPFFFISGWVLYWQRRRPKKQKQRLQEAVSAGQLAE